MLTLIALIVDLCMSANTRNFCTLFDSNYLSRGLVMAESLHRHCPDSHLYIVAFDEVVRTVLLRLALPEVTVVSLEEFEDQELLRVKPNRSAAEYCWTATPSTILYCLQRFGIDECTYLDADMMFYADPEILFTEMGAASVLIPPHRYTPKYDQSTASGIYCVQFVTFRTTAQGNEALQWWRNACLEWCYARSEPGRFGDQKYLDDWPTRFSGVHVLENLGGGLAPWNVQQYEFAGSLGAIRGKELASGKEFSPVFFHYHHFRFFDDGTVDFGPYALSASVKKTFYEPYVRALLSAARLAVEVNPDGDYHGIRPAETGLVRFAKRLKHRLEGRYNRFPLSMFLQQV